MSELSIFIDESGDFGPYDYRSPYYIITMVFHDQSVDISTPITKLEADLSNRGFPNHCVHTGPIIRRENEYEFETIETRRRILNSMVTFIKHCNVKYHSFHIEKKHIEDSVQASAQLSLLISRFLRNHYEELLSYDNFPGKKAVISRTNEGMKKSYEVGKDNLFINTNYDTVDLLRIIKCIAEYYDKATDSSWSEDIWFTIRRN